MNCRNHILSPIKAAPQHVFVFLLRSTGGFVELAEVVGVAAGDADEGGQQGDNNQQLQSATHG